MADFPIQVKVDPGDSKTKIDDVHRTVEQAEKQANAATKAFKGLGEAIAYMARQTLTSATKAFSSLADAIQYKMNTQLTAAQRGFQSLGQAIQHEQKLLVGIRGDTEAYTRDVAALNAMLARGAISAREHAAALAQSRSRAGMGNPLDAVSLPSAAPSTSGPFKSALGAIGAELGGMVGPAALLAASIGSITEEFERWGEHDRMIMNASNQLLRFYDTAELAAAAVHEYVEESQLLGVSVAEQIEAFDAVSDATESLAKTHGQLMDETRNLSMVMIHEGKSLGDVNRVMETLQFAMSKGSLEARELRSVIKEFPFIADMWAKSLNTDRQGLLEMAKSGQIGRREIVGFHAAMEDGSSIAKSFAERQLDIKQVIDTQHISFIEAVDVVIKHKQMVQAAIKPLEDYERAMRKLDERINLVIADMADFDEKLTKAQVKYVTDSIEAGSRQILKAVTDGIDAYNKGIEEAKKRAEELKKLANDTAKAVTDSLVTQLENEVGANRFAEAVGEIDTSWQKVITSQKLADIAAKQYYDDLTTRQKKYAAELASQNDGIARGLNAIKAEINDTAGLTARMLVNAYQGVEDALVDAFRTGKFEWEAFANQIMADLTRLAIRKAIIGGFDLFGSSGLDYTASAGGSWRIPGFAAGGGLVRGGGGATDSAIVPIAMTQGERVIVQTQGQQMRDREAVQRSQVGTQSSQPAILYLDERALLRALNSPMGARVIDDLNRRYPGLRGPR